MYGIFIKRTVTHVNGNGKETQEKVFFPCKVNASVPFNHKMLR